MRCRAAMSWRQPFVMYFRRCLLVDERGMVRSCPMPIGRFRAGDLNAPREVCGSIGTEIEQSAGVRSARWPLARSGLFAGLVFMLVHIAYRRLDLSDVAFLIAVVASSTLVGVLTLVVYGQQVARAHARALSEVCGREGRCAFCLYPLDDLEAAEGARSADERRCPECGGSWTLGAAQDPTS